MDISIQTIRRVTRQQIFDNYKILCKIVFVILSYADRKVRPMRSLLSLHGHRTSLQPEDIIYINRSTLIMRVERNGFALRFRSPTGVVKEELFLDWLPKNIAFNGFIGVLEFATGRNLKSLHTSRADIIHSWEVR